MSLELNSVISVRGLGEGDRAFIFSTMLKGLYHGCELYNQMAPVVFFEKYGEVVEKLLEKATVRVACLSDEPDTIIGYSISRYNALDYIFIKRPWRRQGISKKLLPNEIFVCTHLTRVGNSIRLKRQIEFNPFLL